MSTYLKYTFLYEFTLGSNVWRYTSNAEDVLDVDGNVWEATAISDDGVSQSGEATADAMSVTGPVDMAPARIFMYSPPTKVMDMRVLTAEFADKVGNPGYTGIDNTVDARQIPVFNKRVQYVGEVAQCGFPQPGTVVFTVETISATMAREGLRLGWQRMCPYAVYDPVTCKVNKASHALVTTITNINGRFVSVASVDGAPVARYRAGIMEFSHPIKGAEVMTIEDQAGTSLTMFGPTDDLWIGMTVTIYRGCNQTPEACQSFGNYLNYGGVPSLPGSSPFDGVESPVF